MKKPDMKADVPKKIYLQENTTTDCYGEFWPEWFEARAKDSDVEYICTDNLIEKACEYWYKYNRNIVKKHGAKAGLGCREFTVNVEGFRKYMERIINN